MIKGFFELEPFPTSFSFLIQQQISFNFNYKNRKRHRYYDWCSNLGLQNGRSRRIHSAMAAALITILVNYSLGLLSHITYQTRIFNLQCSLNFTSIACYYTQTVAIFWQKIQSKRGLFKKVKWNYQMFHLRQTKHEWKTIYTHTHTHPHTLTHTHSECLSSESYFPHCLVDGGILKSQPS